LRISQFVLGTMTFGTESYSCLRSRTVTKFMYGGVNID